MLDTRCLLESQKFKEMKESYTIFLYEKDIYGKGEPIYYVNRTIHPMEWSFNDGNNILIVNGQYKGNDSIYDLHCKEPNEIRKEMCELMEQYVKEHGEILAKELAPKIAKDMAQIIVKEEVEKRRIEILKSKTKSLSLKLNISISQAMQLLDINNEDQVKILATI